MPRQRSKKQEELDALSYLMGFFQGVHIREDLKDLAAYTDFMNKCMLALQGKDPYAEPDTPKNENEEGEST